MWWILGIRLRWDWFLSILWFPCMMNANMTMHFFNRPKKWVDQYIKIVRDHFSMLTIILWINIVHPISTQLCILYLYFKIPISTKQVSWLIKIYFLKMKTTEAGILYGFKGKDRDWWAYIKKIIPYIYKNKLVVFMQGAPKQIK